MPNKKSSFTETREENEPPGVRSFIRRKTLFIDKSPYLEDVQLQPFYPYYFKKILSQDLRNYYSKNGHLVLLKSIQLEVVSDPDCCYQLWDEFSPQKTLFDTWEFRLAFLKGYKRRLHFILLKNEKENLALLPLWYEPKEKGFESFGYAWFGSTWQEENSFFVKDPLFVPLLLAACPRPVELNAITLETAFWAKDYVDFKIDDPKYILDLTTINSVDDFLASFTKKKRYNLKRDRKIIEAQKPKIIFNNFPDFKNLVKICNKRFQEKGEDTDWEDPRRIETFRQVIKLGQKGKSYKIRMIAVKIGKKIAGIDLIALYKGCYSPLKCGYDVSDFPGIGNYVNLLEIQDALNLGMRKMDFLEINYGWKDKWFEEIPLFKYQKK